MILKKIIGAALWLTILAALHGCQGTGSRPNVEKNTGKKTSSDSGLASAANRKAIIAELGKNYQKSASGQYRKRVDTIAPFKIQLVDGKNFTYKDIEAHKPVTLVYFSPGCEECKAFTEALLKRIEDFKARQIIFITYEELDHVKVFYKKMNLKKYPQLIVGTEGYSFTVQKYYKIQHFPFIASYDNNGHLIKIYANSTEPEKLASEI